MRHFKRGWGSHVRVMQVLSPGGGGVIRILSDGKVRKILGLKFTISGFFGGKKILTRIFCVDCKNNYFIWESL